MTEALEAPDPLSDAALIAAVRQGDSQAYAILYERHLPAAKRAASSLASTASEREDLVAEAFTKVLQTLRSGRGPSAEFRPYLLVTMRHTAINAARRPLVPLSAYAQEATPAPAEDPVVDRLHGNEAASAFAELPERWRMVLWHTEVVGESPAAIAEQLGMTPNGVSALAYRAREGLRQAYLRRHLPAVQRRECRAATEKLAGWVRRSISAPQRRKVSAHLAWCADCRELANGLAEVNGELRTLLAGAWLWFAKIGVAAAVAAVTAVTVVASETSSSDPVAVPPAAGARQSAAVPEFGSATGNVVFAGPEAGDLQDGTPGDPAGGSADGSADGSAVADGPAPEGEGQGSRAATGHVVNHGPLARAAPAQKAPAARKAPSQSRTARHGKP